MEAVEDEEGDDEAEEDSSDESSEDKGEGLTLECSHLSYF